MKVLDAVTRLGRSFRDALMCRAVVPAIRALLQLSPRFRPATSVAFHLGAYLGRQRPSHTGRLRTGSRIMLNTSEYAHRHLFFHGTYEEPTTDLVKRLSRHGWTFVDVGANAGYFSLLAADLGGETAKVVAFEPNPRLSQMLRASVDLNGPETSRRITVVQAGCSDSRATSSLALSPDPRNSGLSSLEPSVGDVWDSPNLLDINTVRLDEWCMTNGYKPDAVKIDVEGHELSVIRGMTGLLERGRPGALICELTDDPARPHSAAVVDLLATFGYQPFHIVEGGDLRLLKDRSDVSGLENVCFLVEGKASDMAPDAKARGVS